jgi:valyl-tRNA synthetase
MSKVKGNVIDPLDVIHGATLEQLLAKAKDSGASESGLHYLRSTYAQGFATCGADALRMTLLSYSPQTPKIALSIKRIEGYRNFCNKLWNAARYALTSVGASDARAGGPRPEARAFANRWILSRLYDAIEAARKGIDEYRLDDASGALYHFVWDELCDWYLELSKPMLADATEPEVAQETRDVLLHVLEVSLRLLHPIIPFITEEIWQRIAKVEGLPKSIIISAYPEPEREALQDALVEREMTELQQVIVAARTIRSEHDIAPQKTLPLTLRSASAATRTLLERERAFIALLCRAEVKIGEPSETPAPEGSAVSVAGEVAVLADLAGLVDVAKERERLERNLKKTIKDLEAVEKKLNNAGFMERAPQDVVEKERERLKELRQAKAKLEAGLATIPERS